MADNSLAAVVDLELVLQQEVIGEDKLASAQFALMTASAAVRNYCNQYLSRVVDDTVTLDSKGGKLIFLPELPVISVSVVRELGTLLTVDDDYKLAEHGILSRVGTWWRADIQSLQITYTHGFDPIPDDIVAVVARAASRLYQAGLRAEDTAGVLGIASKSLGDFSVSYVSEGTVEGLMGASASRMLLLSEKDALNRYRI